MAPPVRILGVDPGLLITGFGVIDADGPRLSYVASGTISTRHFPTGALPQRIGCLFEGVSEVIRTYSPTQAAVEIVFMNVNPQSTLLLGQARGAAMSALMHGAQDVSEYTALQMKKAVTGHGKAAKDQVQIMVQKLLSLPGLPGTDAADALGLAITHAHAARSLDALSKGAQQAGKSLNRRTSAMYKDGRNY
jgi:crossover junction endodeoxyribonuclease RuvC